MLLGAGGGLNDRLFCACRQGEAEGSAAVVRLVQDQIACRGGEESVRGAQTFLLWSLETTLHI